MVHIVRSRDFPHSKDLFNKMLTERVRSGAENKEIYQLGHVSTAYLAIVQNWSTAFPLARIRRPAVIITSGRMGTTFNAAGKLITAYSLILMGQGGRRAKIEFP